MRRSIIVLALLAAACSKAQREPSSDEARSGSDLRTFDAAESRSAPAGEAAVPPPAKVAGAGPDIGLANLPGISLNYQYGFRVPIEHIAAVQEEHASACEAMTPYRCRITGMTYEAGRNRTISATLNLKLAPADARQFGKKSVSAVVAAGGMLDHARIDSEESGQAIADANRQSASVDEEREQINQQLARPGLKSWEREQLQSRLAQLADQKRAAQDVRADAQRKLASTPMSFTYESGNVDPGFSDGPALGAVKDGWSNIVAGFAVILMLAVTLLPWVVVIGLLIWLARRYGPLLAPKPRAPSVPPKPEE
jgi:Domain of unknown function (DUF4349)